MTDNTTPAAVERLVKELRSQAELASLASRRMAEAKSLRQPDNPEGRSDLYSWATPEQTLEGRAAEALAALSATPAPVSEPSGAGSGEVEASYRRGAQDMRDAIANALQGWVDALKNKDGSPTMSGCVYACAREVARGVASPSFAALPPSKPDAVTIPEGMVPWVWEILIQADLKIRSFPGADQSDVEFIRTALATLSTSNDQVEVERLREVFAACDRFFREAMPKMNIGQSALDANAIDAWNKAEIVMSRTRAALGEKRDG